jgi:hypothetical protein
MRYTASARSVVPSERLSAWRSVACNSPHSSSSAVAVDPLARGALGVDQRAQRAAQPRQQLVQRVAPAQQRDLHIALEREAPLAYSPRVWQPNACNASSQRVIAAPAAVPSGATAAPAAAQTPD